MKKIMTIAAAALFSMATFAQETADNADRVMKIKTTDGESTALMLNTVKGITVEQVTPLTMDIEVSNITETSMDIDFPMPEGCKSWLMCITKDEITGTDAEVRKTIKSKYNDEFKESKFLRIPNFESGTKYYIYALMFDQDSVAAGIAKTSATTLEKQVAKDEFAITVNDVTKTSASITFTPKDNTMKYYYSVVTEDERQQMIERYGSLREGELEFIKYNASSSGFGLSEWLGYVLIQGPTTKGTRDILQANLTPGTKYYAFCFGLNADGTFTTEAYEKEFTTEAVQPSDNVITCEVVKTYSDGCDVKVTTTNNDPYIVNTQKADLWEKRLAQFKGDKKAAARDILKDSYGGYADSYTKTGRQEFKVETSSSDSDCVLIVCGFNADVTTDVQIIPYKTLAE